MINFYLFNNASRATDYGIGTYVKQLSNGIINIPEIKLSWVEMYANTKEFETKEDEHGIRHYLIPPLQSNIENETYCRMTFYFIARNIAVEEFDSLVFQFNYFQHYPLAVLLKGMYPESKIIYTVHYMNWCFELNGNIKRMQKIANKEYKPVNETETKVKLSIEEEKRFLHLSDIVFVLSKRTEYILKENYEVLSEKIHLVYNGFDNNICNINKEKPHNILFLGRLDEIKGLEFLICAFERIMKKHTDAHLIIAGDGDFNTYMKRSRKMLGRVSFLGKLERDEIEHIYDLSYIGVIPSFHEQCSYTAIEMMRHGIPIIGTDSTGLSEMFDSIPDMRVHINEDTFDKDNFIEQIAIRMDLLLSSEDVYHRISDAELKLYETRYTTRTMLGSIRSVIQESLNTRCPSISSDYLVHIDEHLMHLINQRPDISTDFFGLSGIGIYLWQRIQELERNHENEYQKTLLQEYLIYYLDWLLEVVSKESLPLEMIATLYEMADKGFYKTTISNILSVQDSTSGKNSGVPSLCETIHNALKICNCKV
jgi:glycosyltransferase